MVVYALQGDTVDALCWRFYGRTRDVVEAVLEHNPGLAEHGPTLPMGLAVEMLDLTVVDTTSPLLQLFD